MKSVSKEQLPAIGGQFSVGQALDSGLTFTTGGADGWKVGCGASKQGLYSARSGYIGDNQESWMQTQVEGPGTFTFWWKASSEEGSDYLEFWLDGVFRLAISGSTDWEEQTFTLTGSGPHTLQWCYVKSGSGYAGDDCGYVDWVQWSGSCPPAPEPDPTAWLTLLYRAACPERSEWDAAGRRVQKQYDNMTVTKYVYDGDHCIAEYDVSNNLRRKYIYGPSVDEPISMIESAGSYAGTYYYHCDGLGSVVGLTNAGGNTVEVYEYDVYGRLGATDASHPNRILFTGREYDKETGLYYYRARYYNPQIGRFLQTDPIGYGGGLNLYRYCVNNPLGYSDPSGCANWIGGFQFEYDAAKAAHQDIMEKRNSDPNAMNAEWWYLIFKYSVRLEDGGYRTYYGYTIPRKSTKRDGCDPNTEQAINDDVPQTVIDCEVTAAGHSHPTQSSFGGIVYDPNGTPVSGDLLFVEQNSAQAKSHQFSLYLSRPDGSFGVLVARMVNSPWGPLWSVYSIWFADAFIPPKDP
jgi:RHS repeat-associated protein